MRVEDFARRSNIVTFSDMQDSLDVLVHRYRETLLKFTNVHNLKSVVVQAEASQLKGCPTKPPLIVICIGSYMGVTMSTGDDYNIPSSD